MKLGQLLFLAFVSLLLALPLAFWSPLPGWSILLGAPLLALILLRALAALLDYREQRKRSAPHIPSATDAQLAEVMVQNQDFDLANTPPCPGCGATDLAKIVYGKPALTRQILEGLESGRIINGGCMIHNGAPEWHCPNCNKDFGHVNFEEP